MESRPVRFHWLRLRTTVHPTEDPAKVAAALRNAAGLDETTFEGALEATRLEAHHGGESTLLEVELSKTRAIRDLLEGVLDGPVRERFLREVESRTDDDCVFYFRLDKQAAFEGALQVTTGDDAIQARLRLEVHPAKRENAVAAMRHLLAPPAS